MGLVIYPTKRVLQWNCIWTALNFSCILCVVEYAKNDALLVESCPGSTAELLCPAVIPEEGGEEGDRLLAAFWYKDDNVSPFYMVDARTLTAIELGKHRQLSSLGLRSRFDVTVSPAVLHLDVESKKDAGYYVCRVDSYRSSTRTSTVMLRILSPTPKLIIYERQKILNAVAGPYKEGSDVNLSCELTGGEDSPAQLVWVIKGTVVDSTFKTVESGKYKNDYLIRSVGRSLLMVPIVCLASSDPNSTSDPVLKTSVQLDLLLRPLGSRINPISGLCREGLLMEFRCTVWGSRPAAEVTWFLNNFRLYNATQQHSGSSESVTSRLTFLPLAIDNTKKLTCRAVNPKLQSSTVTDSLSLNVTFPPKVSLSLKTYSSSLISEGDTVALMCHISANPPAGPIRWTFTKEAIKDGSTISNAGPQTLVLERLQALHKGSYRCAVNNSEGTSVSDSLWLAVRHRPICKVGQQVSYGAKRGEMLTIRCEVEAEPTVVSFHWSFSNTVVQHYNINHQDRGLRSLATYVPTSDMHLGSLFCWANNSAGEQHVPCTFTVYLPAKPSTPKNCLQVNRTYSSFSVACQAGYDGGATQQFHFHSKVKDSSDKGKSVTTAIPAYTVTNLSAGTVYQVTVTSSNKMGSSEQFVLDCATLKAKDKSLWTWRTNRYTLTTSILALALGVAILIAAAVVRYRSHPLFLRV